MFQTKHSVQTISSQKFFSFIQNIQKQTKLDVLKYREEICDENNFTTGLGFITRHRLEIWFEPAAQ